MKSYVFLFFITSLALYGMEIPEKSPIKAAVKKKIRTIEKIRLRERLYIAIAAKNSEEVKNILAKKIDLGRTPKRRTTPLIAAIRTKNIGIARQLLNAKFNPNECDRWDNFPLMEATMAEDIFMVKLLLQNKTEPNVINEDLQTPLVYACEFYEPSNTLGAIIYELLKAPCNVNMQDDQGRTALHYICTKNHVITSLLLKKGADPNIKDTFGETPLLNALAQCCCSTSQEELLFLIANVQELVGAGSNPDIKNKEGYSARDYAKHIHFEYILGNKESHEQK